MPRVSQTRLTEKDHGVQLASGEYRREMTVSGRGRFYELHVPPSLDTTKPVPVVFVFHGGLGQPAAIRWQTKMDGVSDKNGFIAVYPAGSGPLGGRSLLTWNAGGGAMGYAAKRQIDDMAFVRAIRNDLSGFFDLDPSRVYATGLSNGAQLCYRLAREMADVFAAIAPVGATMTVFGPPPARPVSVVHFHGLEDQNVPFNGGRGEKAKAVFSHRSVEDTVAYWVAANKCAQEAVVVSRENVTIISYGKGSGGAEVVLCKLRDGGHTWPGGDTSSKREAAIVGRVSTAINASQFMWDFFQRHPKKGQAHD